MGATDGCAGRSSAVAALNKSLELGLDALSVSAGAKLPDARRRSTAGRRGERRARAGSRPTTPQRFGCLHPRCGTSFLLTVMIAAVVFVPLGTPAWSWLLIWRAVGIPLVAGPAFEVSKWFGRNRAVRWARILMAPGMKLQRLTTRDPDRTQLAVAIAALRRARRRDAARGRRGEGSGMTVVG